MFDPLQYLTRHVVAPAWAAWEGSAYLRHDRWLKRTQFDPPELIRERQLGRLRDVVAHACATVPYYRKLGLRAGDVRTFEDFRAVPVLTKQDIRAHFDELLSESYRGRTLSLKETSGSTGVPLRVLVDEGAMQFKRACTLRGDEWSGWRRGQRVAKLWGRPEGRPGWRARLRDLLLERVDYLDTLRLTDRKLAEFARRLHRRPPGLIFGHAHSLYLLARFVGRNGPGGIRPRGIVSTAMVLHDWQRRAIEEVFACRVTNRYGCEEVSLIACECERHDGLHVNADGVYVEVLAGGWPAADGEAGAVVVTDLANRAMPLLRYKVGDVAALTARRCPCGRGLPLLERVAGREADYVTTESGRLVSGISLTDHFAAQVPGVAQMQIVQESRTRFLFRVVPGAGFGEASLGRLGGLVRDHFGPNTGYEVEYVEEIAPEASGKYRFCISRVPVAI